MIESIFIIGAYALLIWLGTVLISLLLLLILLAFGKQDMVDDDIFKIINVPGVNIIFCLLAIIKCIKVFNPIRLFIFIYEQFAKLLKK